VHHHLAAQAGLRVRVAQHRALDLAADHRRFHQHLVVVAQRQCQCLGEARRVLDLAHAHRRTLVGRLHEQRQAELRDHRIDIDLRA
jgi:hypothetical protein